MSLHTIPLQGAELALDPAWLAPAEATALFEALRSAVEWRMHRVRIFGREVDSPRLSSWIGDPDVGYRYSGIERVPAPWLPVLQPIRERLHATTGTRFNSVLANLYRDGDDAMGWHSDDERELGDQPRIASLSLGATRRFRLKSRQPPDRRLSLDLPHGSLLLMAGDTQRHYRHALPRTRKPVGERINLTFRRIGGDGGDG